MQTADPDEPAWPWSEFGSRTSLAPLPAASRPGAAGGAAPVVILADQRIAQVVDHAVAQVGAQGRVVSASLMRAVIGVAAQMVAEGEGARRRLDPRHAQGWDPVEHLRALLQAPVRHLLDVLEDEGLVVIMHAPVLQPVGREQVDQDDGA